MHVGHGKGKTFVGVCGCIVLSISQSCALTATGTNLYLEVLSIFTCVLTGKAGPCVNDICIQCNYLFI